MPGRTTGAGRAWTVAWAALVRGHGTASLVFCDSYEGRSIRFQIDATVDSREELRHTARPALAVPSELEEGMGKAQLESCFGLGGEEEAVGGGADEPGEARLMRALSPSDCRRW